MSTDTITANEVAAIDFVHIAAIEPSPENDQLYRPISEGDPEIAALASSIRKFGVREPLVVTLDGFILSGHRRYAAAKLAGLRKVPVRYEPIDRDDGKGEQFLELLREYNRQREKSFDEKLRESIVSDNPDDAYFALTTARENAARVDVAPMEMRKRRRSAITDVKQEMLNAVLSVLEDMADYIPISERKIHYELQSSPPRRNTKTGLMYENNRRSSSDLSDLITRARAAGIISWDDISDETRPVTLWRTHRNVGSFLEKSVDGFLTDFWRDLLQSQPNHYELVIEKNTMLPIVKPVAGRYTLPVTSCRGNSSKAPLWDIVKRFNASGKDKLVLFLLSDFDADGISITDSLCGYMLHDFEPHGINEDTLHPIRVGLWKEQVLEMDNPPTSLEPNTRSKNCPNFVELYGKDCWELEAIKPDHMQRILTDAIDSAIDIDLFNAELEAEISDSVRLRATRKQLRELLLNEIKA